MSQMYLQVIKRLSQDNLLILPIIEECYYYKFTPIFYYAIELILLCVNSNALPFQDLEQEAPAEKPDSKPPSSWPSSGSVALKSVCFRYRPNLPLVLKDVDVQIDGGQKVSHVIAMLARRALFCMFPFLSILF